MNNSKLDFIQSVSEQKQKADQLQESLHRLSEMLKAFEMTIEQSERPITQNTMRLHEVHQTTIALKSHLSAILTEISHLSPQALKTATASYKAQMDALATQLASIDLSQINKVKSSIDSFSVALQQLQDELNQQVLNIKIDKTSLERSIQTQVEQAIAQQSEKINTQFDQLLTERLTHQRTMHILWGIIIFAVLMISISIYFAFQVRNNAATIQAQQQIIQQHATAIGNQQQALEYLRR